MQVGASLHTSLHRDLCGVCCRSTIQVVADFDVHHSSAVPFTPSQGVRTPSPNNMAALRWRHISPFANPHYMRTDSPVSICDAMGVVQHCSALLLRAHMHWWMVCLQLLRAWLRNQAHRLYVCYQE